MAAALRRGEWEGVVNGLWSPLYPCMVAAAAYVLRPPPSWEPAVGHLVTFVATMASLVAFHFLLKELIRRQVLPGSRDDRDREPLPVWLLWTVGYLIAVHVVVEELGFAKLCPDHLVMLCVLVSCTLSLQMARGLVGWFRFGLLGFVLGTGYLAKAPVLPFAAMQMVALLLILGRWRQALPRVLLALGVMLLVMSPLVLALSVDKGRFTLGESGKLNYAWHVNGYGKYCHWQGSEGSGGGAPNHPSRVILASPTVFEFGAPLTATYPPWYDPSYWNEGLLPRFRLTDQARAFIRNTLQAFYVMFYEGFYVALATFYGLMIALSGGGRRAIRVERATLPLLILPSVIMILLYLAVHSEPRYVAPYILLILVGLLTFLSVPRFPQSKEFVARAGGVISVVLLIMILGSSVRAVWRQYKHVEWGGGGSDPARAICQGLRQMGLRPGDKIGCIGSGYIASYWARQVPARIVAELPPPDGGNDKETSWKLGHMIDRRVIDAFSEAGVKFIVANVNVAVGSTAPGLLVASGWSRIGKTNHYVFIVSVPEAHKSTTSPGQSAGNANS
ncbi:MAG: hypothetical protein JXQ73_08495 [Phycisphaerae bacterium]|nr:hypothetical protein [Phycisphaerae bacterium]